MPKINELIGKTFEKVDRVDGRDSDEIRFIGPEGSYRFYHYQDCCESVSIEDITGDLEDLVGTPILVAEERCEFESDTFDESQWTFYTFRTIKGSVDIRWYGTSNGYYSTGVDFESFEAR